MYMESEKSLVARNNPRTVLFAGATRLVPNELSQKQPTPVFERFRALLKQRVEAAARISGVADNGVAPALRTVEVVRLYELVLAELTFNSKPVITDLTIIADELREHGEGIANAICTRIIEASIEQKLPSLYLLDSIVKNIGREYVRYFSSQLPEVFCEAYRQVHPTLYPSMRHLFGTWSSVFPRSVLSKIETQLQFSSKVNDQSSSLTSLRASESPRPTHGIHVNPKYVRQLEPPTADIEEVLSLRTGAQRLHATGGVGHTSFEIGAKRLLPSPISRLARPLSPSRIGAERPVPSKVDDFAMPNSPRMFVEGVSPYNPAFDCILGRIGGRDEGGNDWRRKLYFDDNLNRFEASIAYRLSSGHEHQGPRALIDAYGEDKRNGISKSKPLQIECLDVNGVGNKGPTRSWQNTEEEEFDWEDMNTTFANRGRINDTLSSVAPRGGSDKARPHFGTPSSVKLGTDIESELPSQAQRLFVEGFSSLAEDVVPTLDSGHVLTGKMPGFLKEKTQIMASRRPQEAWNLSRRLPLSTHLTNDKGRGKDFQMTFSGGGLPSSGCENLALIDNNPDTNTQLIRPPTIASRLGSGIDSNIYGVPPSAGEWPGVNVYKSQPHPAQPSQQSRNHLDSINDSSIFKNQGLQKTSLAPYQQFSSLESKEHSLTKEFPFPTQFAPLNLRNQAQVNPVHPEFLPSFEAQESFPPASSISISPSLNHRYTTQGHGATFSKLLSNSVSNVQTPVSVSNISNTLHSRVGLHPPLLPRTFVSQMTPATPNAGPVISNQPPGPAFSGLINSLMAQGFISLTKQTPMQDSVGLEFNADLLKLRVESAISALYADLPRQCTTCGLRFKCQKEHSSHMDWHVTRNRMSKSHKQKPSRKWFVSSSMWLSGAEALGTDAVPGFLSSETFMEKEDEEMSVPADEEQNACTLCGEPFDDFYSDETEEWMYRGAVYLNAPNGSIGGMDRSQLGPIVHAKCRSESDMVPPEGVGHDGGGKIEDGSHRKRKRS